MSFLIIIKSLSTVTNTGYFILHATENFFLSPQATGAKRLWRTRLVYSNLNAFKMLQSATCPPATSTPCLQILRVLILRQQEFLVLGGLHKHIQKISTIPTLLLQDRSRQKTMKKKAYHKEYCQILRKLK